MPRYYRQKVNGKLRLSLNYAPILLTITILTQEFISYYWSVLKNNYKKALAHFKKVDPKIYKVARTVDFEDWFSSWCDPVDQKNYFAALCRDIIGQQLSGKAANSIHRRFVGLLGKKNITPNNVMNIKDQDLRDVGLSWAKVKYIKDLAEKVIGGDVNIDGLDKLEDEAVIKELTKVKGIGDWTAEMFLIFTLGREDVFSHGDLGLRKGLVKVCGLRKMPSMDRVEKIVRKWSPYKSYGSVSLWHALDQG